jgi:hypothetical protein
MVGGFGWHVPSIRHGLSGGEGLTSHLAIAKHGDGSNRSALAFAHTDTSAAATLTSANAFTTNAVGALTDDFNTFQANVDNEFQIQDRRISKIGAMGTAMSSMAMNTAGLPDENRIGVGEGLQNGQSAFAVGFQHAFHHANVSLGCSFSSGESSVGIGAGLSW